MFQRIVGALDGSPRGERGLDAAVELATRLRVPLHLVRVADLTVVAIGANEAALEYASLSDESTAEEREAREYLDQVAARLATDGLTITTEVRSGYAAKELIAAMTPGDILVMTSHGRTGAARLLLGSVAEEVSRHALCPVLLVRAAGDDE